VGGGWVRETEISSENEIMAVEAISSVEVTEISSVEAKEIS
jgi:hypothetical protein